ncbi:hypothetical protein [Thalassoglobus sp.]|uniref:hypothetical protein n=1 Tax=Thalassoglobus sp. TaxID=2795869 RepID=UPI003AA811C5
MIIACRVLLLIAFSVFWGGLTFYTGIVVRIAHDVLTDSMVGGLITQRVTHWLQIAGGVTAALMLWNTALVMKVSRKYGFPLVACSLVLAFSILGLVVVHGHLDAVIDLDAVEITDRDAFTISHRRYNQLTTIEWISSLTYLMVTLAAWRHVDARPPVQQT